MRYQTCEAELAKQARQLFQGHYDQLEAVKETLAAIRENDWLERINFSEDCLLMLDELVKAAAIKKDARPEDFTNWQEARKYYPLRGAAQEFFRALPNPSGQENHLARQSLGSASIGVLLWVHPGRPGILTAYFRENEQRIFSNSNAEFC
ncbi:MAG: hypothetical protein U0Y68_15720 [Blastocatellia bacterium]